MEGRATRKLGTPLAMQLCEQVEVVAGGRGWHAETFRAGTGRRSVAVAHAPLVAELCDASEHLAERFARLAQHAVERRRAGREARAAGVVERVDPQPHGARQPAASSCRITMISRLPPNAPQPQNPVR